MYFSDDPLEIDLFDDQPTIVTGVTRIGDRPTTVDPIPFDEEATKIMRCKHRLCLRVWDRVEVRLRPEVARCYYCGEEVNP